MRHDPLDGNELDDLGERWRGWFADGPIVRLSKEDLVGDAKTWSKAAGFALTEEEASELAASAAGTIFRPPNQEINPLVDDTLGAIKERVPELRDLAEATPVLLLPTLEFKAFKHELQSGRPYVALSLSMIWQPALMSALALMALDGINRHRAEETGRALNGLILMAWHLKSLNHELISPYTKGEVADRAATKHSLHMAKAMTAFVILHEFAHIQLNHRRTGNPEEDRQQEFDADSAAVRWWCELFSPREHWDYLVLALGTYFRIHNLYEILGETKPVGHPSWNDRLVNIVGRLGEGGVPLDFINASETVFVLAAEKALRMIVTTLDGRGRPQAYGHPAGTMKAVNGIANGTSDYTILIIAPDGTTHENTITQESYLNWKNQSRA